MKKLFALLLAAAMTATVSFGAAAATELGESPAKGKGVNDYIIGVNGSFVAGAAAKTEISVDITWEAMNFTYTAGDSTYDSATHTTTAANGSWSEDKHGVTVTNHSNIGIDATLSFTATESGLIGTFYTAGDGDDYTAITTADEQKITLGSAEGKTRNDDDASADRSPKGTLYFGVSGAVITENEPLGTITVKLATADSVTEGDTTAVYTAKGFTDALAAGGNVKLGGNITLGDVTLPATAKLDLNGKSLTVDALTIDNGHDLTVADSSAGQTGKICKTATGTAEYLITVKGGKLDVQSGSIESVWSEITDSTLRPGAVKLEENGSATVSGGKITGMDDGIYVGDSTATLTVSGGTITATRAVHTSGTTTISGGTLNGTRGCDRLTLAGILQEGGEVTVSGGRIRAGQIGVWISIGIWQRGGKLTVENGTLCMIGQNAAGVQQDWGELTISGGTFEGSNNLSAIFSAGTVTVTGGNFDCECFAEMSGGELLVTGGDVKAECAILMYFSANTAQITGGTFEGYFSVNGDGTLSITGGTFSYDPTAYVDADACTVTPNDTEAPTSWTVTERNA